MIDYDPAFGFVDCACVCVCVFFWSDDQTPDVFVKKIEMFDVRT